MKHFFAALLLLFAIQSGFSQNNKSWKGYFSYREIKDISEAPTRLIAASENALFTKDLVNGAIKTTNTVDGLSGQTISSVYHSEAFRKTLIGYENGLMIVVNEVDGSILNVVDIINKALPPDIKKINHFMEYNGIVYISCDFGIVEYNLATLVFGSTFFIGNNGAQIVIKQTAIFNNKIYAATDSFGIRSADINNANLNDFSQWTTLDGNGWIGVEAFSDGLYAMTNQGGLYHFQGGNFVQQQAQYPQPSVDFRKSGDYLIATTPNHVYIYNSSMILVRDINSAEVAVPNLKFSCATIINDIVYLGTVENGMFSTSLTGSPFEDMTPSGPLRNNIFAMKASSTSLWAVFGDYDISYRPDNPLRYYGISKFNTNNWLNITYDELQAAVGKPVTNLVRISIHPTNANLVYISSFNSGLLKLENDVPTMLYDQTNTGTNGLQPFPNSTTVRIDGTAFDKVGNLWVTNSLTNKGLKVLTAAGQWNSYDLSSLFTPAQLGSFNMGRLTIDKNGTKWITTRDQGLVAFNETYSTVPKTIKSTPETGNLPDIDARVSAVDTRNQLWIGTKKGLRVLSSVDSYLTDQQMITENIVFIEDNLPQELMYEQFIKDIVVDGSNNKWIATADAGVFLVSPNGQQTIYNFTSSNSPLPSNSVNDIEINGTTGEVFIATDKGMVSFKGTATDANDNLNNVYVYPNPVRPEFNGTVKVSGLIDKANVKIADIEGNLVYETISEGGTIEWDTTAFGKYKVASGVYMIFISAEDGGETKVKKVMIIR